MNFEIPEVLVKQLLCHVEADSPLGKQLNAYNISHGRMLVASDLFDSEALNTLYTLSKNSEERQLMFQMLALDNIRGAPDARKIPSLDLLINGLIAYIKRDGIDGWLYKRNADGVLLPWLVKSMRHVFPDVGKDYVVVSLLANTMQAAGNEPSPEQPQRYSGMTTAIVINKHDIADKTIPELLAEQGFYKECKEFKQEYETHAKRFIALQKQFGQQFLVRQAAFIPGPKGRLDYVRLPAGTTVKCINDEEVLERRFDLQTSGQFWREAGIETGFDRIPLHCYLYMFHMEWHRNIWVHVQNMSEYRYKPALRDKLVLPQAHRDLIDILTTDMHVLRDDFIDGKSGGTTILCKGLPGLGKTLTAEVYSEVVGKPLYRVHSGQLGITAESVEANLTDILRRAERWGAILLLDEADVYIRQRDNDLQHNAIVAEFLRTLEYFSGLLFMTTNRTNDVDDAILSRCIAIISYETPSSEAAHRLWQNLAEQFEVELPEALIEELTRTYASASGRDIKELLKLTAKYCNNKNAPLSAEAFRQCAVFKGIA
jgi:hypothetical protein